MLWFWWSVYLTMTLIYCYLLDQMFVTLLIIDNRYIVDIFHDLFALILLTKIMLWFWWSCCSSMTLICCYVFDQMFVSLLIIDNRYTVDMLMICLYIISYMNVIILMNSVILLDLFISCPVLFVFVLMIYRYISVALAPLFEPKIILFLGGCTPALRKRNNFETIGVRHHKSYSSV